MKADDAQLLAMLESRRQYIVPLFQRPYTWEEKRWSDLWDDLLEVYHSPIARRHFIGSIVTMLQDANPAGVPKYLLIDGQQRVTTLLILLSAIRDLAKQKQPSSHLSAEIDESYLVNKFVKLEGDQYKLIPSEPDQEAFILTMSGSPPSSSSRMARCKKWYLDRLGEKDETGQDLNLENLKDAVVSNLVLVSVSLDKDENPYLIFETLNARGTPLTEADLIRNFFFMRIDLSRQKEAYHKKWLPMQSELGEEYLTEFFRHFLLKDGGVIKAKEVYITLKERYADKSASDMLQLLDVISVFAGFYRNLLHPANEQNANISYMLKRLNEWEVTTAYPLLLNLYSLYSKGVIEPNQFLAGLVLIESYIVRRFVCNIPTRSLHRYFPSISKSINAADPVNSLVDGLKKFAWPDDNTFLQSLKAAPLYWFGQGAARILRSLEESYGHKEPAALSNTTIEHIMPQTLTPEWIQALGNDYEKKHQTYLHTLGNLTLSAYNTTLYNNPFPEKKKDYAQSHLELNRYVCSFDNWNEKTIEERADALSKKALSIWPRPP